MSGERDKRQYLFPLKELFWLLPTLGIVPEISIISLLLWRTYLISASRNWDDRNHSLLNGGKGWEKLQATTFWEKSEETTSRVFIDTSNIKAVFVE